MFKKLLNNKLWIIKNIRSLKNWHKRNFRSPSPEFVKQKILECHNTKNCLWIETGTYYGQTTNFLSKIAEKVISIEADKRLFDIAYNKFKLCKNVELHFGKSENILKNILQKNRKFKNLNIFFDAHLCHDHKKKINTFGTKNKSTPIIQELMTLEKNLKRFKNVNILIDDIRLFEIKYHNYPGIDVLVNWCRKNNLKWTIEQDIFIAKNY